MYSTRDQVETEISDSVRMMVDIPKGSRNEQAFRNVWYPSFAKVFDQALKPVRDRLETNK